MPASVTVTFRQNLTNVSIKDLFDETFCRDDGNQVLEKRQFAGGATCKFSCVRDLKDNSLGKVCITGSDPGGTEISDYYEFKDKENMEYFPRKRHSIIERIQASPDFDEFAKAIVAKGMEPQT